MSGGDVVTFWTAERVASSLGTSGVATGVFTGVSTDTRALTPGSLFVALKGERFDAHAFLPQALAAGAAAAVVRPGTPAIDGLPLYVVEDTLDALGRLARSRRRDLKGPVIAVTGTAGKTATKGFLRCALSVGWTVHATRENLNNLVGVPLTILEAKSDVTALVIEAGASVRGEIARLRGIIEPTIAVITNVSAGHVEGFGSVEAILEEKCSLAVDAPVAIVGTSPPALAERARSVARRVVVAGTDPAADVRPDSWSVGQDGRGLITIGGTTVQLPLIGRHQIDNAMLAVAAGRELTLPEAAALRALALASLPPGRLQVVEAGSLMVIHDAYNANPASVAAALETAAAMRGERRLVVVLGSMLELGAESDKLHRKMATHVLGYEPAVIAATGLFRPAFEALSPTLGNRLIVADDPAVLGQAVADRLEGDELVLLKASRGVHLERALPFLLPEYRA